MTTSEAWEILENYGVSSDTLDVITDINGYSLDTLENVLYAVFGYNDFEQFLEDNPEF